MPDEIRLEDLPPLWAVVNKFGRRVCTCESMQVAVRSAKDFNKFSDRNGPFTAIKYAAVEVVQEGGSDG